MEKLHDYQGFVGRLHSIRDDVRERFQRWRDEKNEDGRCRQSIQQQYSHIYRKKTRCELIRLSTAVMGIEFSYAAETAFVSPTLLEIGVEHAKMTLVWALSPLVGFFLTPFLGSLSDRCHFHYGRRRPFIILLAIGVLTGLILVPSGKGLGQKLGDYYPPRRNQTHPEATNRTSPEPLHPHPWGVFFTVLGTVLLDFDADACQSPARAYLLDVIIPEDQARGLSTFTIMAGLGGFMGYALGGINWDATVIGEMFGGHVKAVFSVISIIFVLCVVCTVTSFKEVPLEIIECDALSTETLRMQICKVESKQVEDQPLPKEVSSYGSMVPSASKVTEQETQFGAKGERTENINEQNGYVNHGFEANLGGEKSSTNEISSPTLKEYLMSIVYMPASLRILCLTNLFCWMAHVCYSLYFTDYVGESVFGGDPMAPEGSDENELYEEGVRFGCWGMSLYSLSCACYSLIIEKLIKKFGAKKVYVGGLLFYSCGMLLMALVNNKFGVIAFSWTAGVMYSTLFTMPYLLVAHYHSSNTFSECKSENENQLMKRGLGTDVALVSSMVFLAQFTLSLCMGTIISVSGSTKAIVFMASLLALCGSITATQVLYLDL